DDSFGKSRVAARDFVQDLAEGLLRRHAAFDLERQARWHVDARSLVAARIARGERYAIEKALERSAWQGKPCEAIPLLAVCDTHQRLELPHLLEVHEAGVVVLVPRQRQSEALDGVGDEAGRLVARPR